MTERDDFDSERLEVFKNYFDSLEDSELTSSGEEIAKRVYEIPTSEESKYAAYQFTINTASFRVSVEKNTPEKFVSVYYPSRLDELTADEMYREVTCVIDSAYPRRRYTPQALLIHQDGREEKYDLTNHWDGKLYEKSVNNQGLKGVVHYFESDYIMPASMSAQGRKDAFFVHGFINEAGIIEEFVRMQHAKASSLDNEFSGELLKRHKGYVEHNIQAEVFEFKDKMGYICAQNPTPKIGF